MEKMVVQYLYILGSRNFYEGGGEGRCLPARFITYLYAILAQPAEHVHFVLVENPTSYMSQTVC